MAGLDDLFAQIPVQDIANKIGADEGEVNNAIRTLVPALVGGVAENVQADQIDSSDLESAVAQQGASGLLDGGVSVDQVDAKRGRPVRREDLRRQRQQCGGLRAGRHRRRWRRSDQEAAADPGADRAGLYRQATHARARRRPRHRLSRRPPAAGGSATSSAASWAARAVPVAVATTRSAASWAACSVAAVAVRAIRSARSSAGCSAARSSFLCTTRRKIPHFGGVSGPFPSSRAVFLEWLGDRQLPPRPRRPAQVLGSRRGRERPLPGLGQRRLLQGRRVHRESPPTRSSCHRRT